MKKVAIAGLLPLLAACQFTTDDDDDGPACIEERFELTRDERRRGIILSEKMTNINFGASYSRAEVVARYRLYRGNYSRTEPTKRDIETAERLIAERSDNSVSPDEVLVATPCMYIEVIT